MKLNLADFLTDTANRTPDHCAIRFEGKSITFAQMNRRVDALANGLTRLGLRAEDVCILMMPNSLNWALIYYSLSKLGAVVVPVNFLYRQRELEYIFVMGSMGICRPLRLPERGCCGLGLFAPHEDPNR